MDLLLALTSDVYRSSYEEIVYGFASVVIAFAIYRASEKIRIRRFDAI